MRAGDFSEVLAVDPDFRLYDPATGNQSTGAGRAEFGGAAIPANRISSIAQSIQSKYPLPNVAGTNNGTQNNYEVARFPEATRDNYDVKVNWNRTSANQIWGKYSMMDASVQDLFYMPFTEAGGGDTTVKLWSIGQTYTISPTLIWDATFGSNVMDHASQGPDFGTNYGLDEFGIPGTNNAGTTGVGSQGQYADFYSGMPAFNTGLAVIGNDGTLDAGDPPREELHVLDQRDEGCRQARNPQRLRLRPPEPRPLAAGDQQPARQLRLRRGHHRYVLGTRVMTGTATPRSCSARTAASARACSSR